MSIFCSKYKAHEYLNMRYKNNVYRFIYFKIQAVKRPLKFNLKIVYRTVAGFFAVRQFAVRKMLVSVKLNKVRFG